MGLIPVRARGRLHGAPQPGAVAQEHERLLAQRRDADVGAAGELVLAPDHEHDLVLEQGMCVQPGWQTLLDGTNATSSWSASTAEIIDGAISSTTRMSTAGWR